VIKYQNVIILKKVSNTV